MTAVTSGIQWAERQLKDLPTVSLGKVSLLGLDWGTFLLVVAMCIWKDTTDSNTTLWAWLGFLAGMHGISYANFSKAADSPTTAPSGATLPPALGAALEAPPTPLTAVARIPTGA
jgi:hypothetical protein